MEIVVNGHGSNHDCHNNSAAWFRCAQVRAHDRA